MRNNRIAIALLCMTALGGCSSTTSVNHTRPSVTYSNDTINNDDSPPIEDNTPVGKAITIMESSNPELITDYHMVNDPELVASHIERPKDKQWFVPGRKSKVANIIKNPPKTEKVDSETLPAPKETALTPAQRFKAIHHAVTPPKQGGAFSFSD